MLNIKEINCSIDMQRNKLAGKMLHIAKGSCKTIMSELSTKDIINWQITTVIDRTKELHLTLPNFQCLAMKIWDGKVRPE